MKFRNDAIETLLFTLFFMLLLALIVKTMTTDTNQEDKPVEPIDEIEIIKHSFDEPKDFAKDSTLSLQQIRVYEHWYDQK